MTAKARGANGPQSVSLGSKAAQEATVELQLDHGHTHGKLPLGAFLLMSWTCIGVIFGDICTSPLYVYSSIFAELTPDSTPTRADILGVVSLIFWTLTLEVLVKYMGVVLRADDQGQGGTFALYSLLCRHIGIKPHGVRGPAAATAMSKRLIAASAAAARASSASSRAARAPRGIATLTAATVVSATAGASVAPSVNVDAAGGDESDSDSEADDEPAAEPKLWWQRYSADKERMRGFFRRSRGAQVVLWCVSVTATAMLIGDGVLTPAMSVLSAVSGLSVAVPNLGQDVIIGVTIAILVFIFALQQLGTGMVGKCFAPIIALWLVANAAINAYNLAQYGGYVFNALNPAHIVTLFAHRGSDAWRSLGAVMLCVTGAEALFADLGHFSRGSISAAFGVLAYPCLIITYLGQAAFLIQHPEDTDTFWKSLPSKLLYPMLVLATLATIVASQALISGVFSIVRQAMILGAFPPVRVVHTGGNDPHAATQVYVPLANFVLLVLCCTVVGGFQSTVALGKAYGLAVMTDMMTTTCLVTLVMLTVWGTSLLFVVPFFLLFLVVEGAYWSANIIKVPQGGWFTLAVAFCVSVIMFVWWAGSRRLGERLAALTAGSQIRVLGPPQPPPLLATAPLPAARSTARASASGGPAVAAATAAPYTPGNDAPFPVRILSRISSWALSRNSSSRAQSGMSPGSAALASPAAGGGPSDRHVALPIRRSRASHNPGDTDDGIATSSAPLPKLEAKSAFVTVQANGNGKDLPHLPQLEAKSSAVGGAGSGHGGHLHGKLSTLGSSGLLSKASAGAGGLAAAGGSVRGGILGRFTRSWLHASTSVGGPHAAPPGTPKAAPSPRPPSRSGLSVLRRRYRPMPEAAFTPGTLALVLPPEAEIGVAAAARRNAGAAAAAAARKAADADPEMGSTAAEMAAAADAAAAAAAQPLIVPLRTRLAGIGVYYMDEKIGVSSDTSGSLPPVLVHFLGNVQAIHEVCVFLSVRRFPIPSVPRRRRLHVYVPHSATPPNFYQVVARYGYLDIIDHGPAFMSELLDAVLRRLAQAARATFIAGHHHERSLFASEGPLPEEEPSAGSTDSSVPGRPQTGGGGGGARVGGVAHLSRLAQHSTSVIMRLAANSASRHGPTAGLAAVAAAAALLPTQGSVDAGGAADPTGLSLPTRALGTQGLPVHDNSIYKGGVYGGVAAEELPVEGGSVGVPAADAVGVDSSVGGAGVVGTAAPPGQQSARRAAAAAARWGVEDTLAAFLEAQLHGVVYYASRPLIRPDPRADAWPLTRVWHWFLYGLLYGFLVSITYDDMQRWNVPGENLVELGMHVEI